MKRSLRYPQGPPLRLIADNALDLTSGFQGTALVAWVEASVVVRNMTNCLSLDRR